MIQITLLIKTKKCFKGALTATFQFAKLDISRSIT